MAVIIAAAGLITGFIAAEYVRKRYGLDNFFGRLSATPDIDGGNIMDERQYKKE